jgi:hypothetical protein
MALKKVSIKIVSKKSEGKAPKIAKAIKGTDAKKSGGPRGAQK